MERLEAHGLVKQFLRGGDDNHHIGSGVGMMILISDAVNERGSRDRAREQRLQFLRRFADNRQIVEAHISPRGLPYDDLVGSRQFSVDREGPYINGSHAILVGIGLASSYGGLAYYDFSDN